ncbi:hypothetical protein M1293_00125 [Candidatus Parvarchaeota archaeon]|nr:hypothetical protein [Candidatus Parvarchaeota archaeon]
MGQDYFLAEVSFEAGNKVGGIWTVLTSKSGTMKKLFGDDYLAVGFYNQKQASTEVMEETPPDAIKKAISEMGLDGVDVHYGRWVSANEVKIVLIDSSGFKERHVNEVKKTFWDLFKIDSLDAPNDYNEPIAWAYAAGVFLEKLSSQIGKRLVVQVHEWLSAGSILYLKSKNSRIPTNFTIHATVLGRAISYNGGDTIAFINSNTAVDVSMPYKYGVNAKHCTEKAGAFNATVFTVVSRIVEKEAEVILGKKADFITLNGIDTLEMPNVDDLDSISDAARSKFENFVDSYFLPYYDFQAEDLPVFITGGRYEFYDKGFDLFIDSLGRLDKKLQAGKGVIALVAVPTGTIGVKNEVAANYLAYLSIKSSLDEDIKRFDVAASSVLSKNTGRLDKAYSKILNDEKRLLSNLRKTKPSNPPVCPFLLSYPEENDMIITRLRQNGLENSPDNKVKVIFYPKYLSFGDELLNLTYYEVLAMSTAGFFLSKYEPFGYTPLEAASYMSIAFTTDHAGFGIYCTEKFKTELKGIVVEKLTGNQRDKVVEQIANDMLKIVNMPEDDILRLKISARKVSENFGWESFISYYLQAYDAALKRA